MNEVSRILLKKARDTYGFKNQITVAIEELCELSTILAKYPRYEEHENAILGIRKKVLEEYADVVVVLDHVFSIFNLTEREVDEAIAVKIARLARWMDTDSSLEYTTKDRMVGCSTSCRGWEHLEECTKCGGKHESE